MGNGDRRNSLKMRRRKSQRKHKDRLQRAAAARAERIASAGRPEKKPLRTARKPTTAG
jgi:hypothetical protein